MNPDQKVAYFVNCAGIFSFSLIIIIHFINVLANTKDESSKSKTN